MVFTKIVFGNFYLADINMNFWSTFRKILPLLKVFNISSGSKQKKNEKSQSKRINLSKTELFHTSKVEDGN